MIVVEQKSNRTRSRLIDCVGYCRQPVDALVKIDSDFIRPPTKHVTTQWPDQWILVLFSSSIDHEDRTAEMVVCLLSTINTRDGIASDDTFHPNAGWNRKRPETKSRSPKSKSGREN